MLLRYAHPQRKCSIRRIPFSTTLKLQKTRKEAKRWRKPSLLSQYILISALTMVYIVAPELSNRSYHMLTSLKWEHIYIGIGGMLSQIHLTIPIVGIKSMGSSQCSYEGAADRTIERLAVCNLVGLNRSISSNVQRERIDGGF